MDKQITDESQIAERNKRKERARLSMDALNNRPNQYELYAEVVFDQDHVVGSERLIPLRQGEILLAPGHLDPLFQLGLIEESELYKVSQNSLREGVQKAHKSEFRFKDTLTKALNPAAETFTLHKEADQVWGKVRLKNILRRDALQHPDIQTIFLHLLEQQTGSFALKSSLDIARRQFVHWSGNENASRAADIRQLIVDTEVDSRRKIQQELTIRDFLNFIHEFKPELEEVYTLNGETTFTDKIKKRLLHDLGMELDFVEQEDLLQKLLRETFTPPKTEAQSQ